jgi:hypothetical protein
MMRHCEERWQCGPRPGSSGSANARREQKRQRKLATAWKRREAA